LRRAVSYSVTAERGRCGAAVVVVLLVMLVMCAAPTPRTTNHRPWRTPATPHT